MIKMYLWTMRGKNVGHLSLELSDGTYISFWPAEDLEMKRKKRSGANTYENDVESEGRAADEILELPNDIIDQEKVKSWWNDFVDKNKYHLLFNNCAKVVEKALLVGGIYQTPRMEDEYFNMFRPVEVFGWASACKRIYPQKSDDSIAEQIFRGIGNFFKK